MSTKKSKLSLLFERPQESIALGKGQGKKTQFIVPQNYLNEKLAPIATQIVDRFGGDADEQVDIPEISIPPLGDILDLPRDDAFSIFNPRHIELAAKLTDLFMGMRTPDDLLAMAIYCREHVNPYLFQYSLAVTLLHRKDTADVDIPAQVQTFPEKYIENNAIGKAREQVTVVQDANLRTPITIPKDYTASDLELEHRLAYFREDIGINLHHWHWHLVYPVSGDKSVIDKDRRGELFFYMHRQVLARYNFDRLCNDLQRVERLVDFDAPIPEAYFPKLDRIVTNRAYPSRVANQRLQNLRREGPTEGGFVDVDDLKRWRDTILAAIRSGVVRDTQGKEVKLDEFKGIDILGNMIEATDLSINPQLYGNLHNMGHNLISLIHDPDGRHKEKPGVMGDVSTAMRDPIFYRWHSYIDDMFLEFKDSLPAYPENKLNYPGIAVQDIQLQTKGRNANTLLTFWQQSDVNIAKGLDFQNGGDVFIRFTHLQHAEFTYEIKVQNTSGKNKEGTCRIFLAPRVDEKGLSWQFRDQKNMFIEMDKFKVTLKQGPNTITRSSTQSSVTIPWERTYRDLRNTDQLTPEQRKQTDFCGCGWPHNMLVPKGKPEGLECDLFVMISNYDDDKIDQDISGECNDAYSYCGVKDKLYPDRRSMGYPFDRQARAQVKTLQQFLTSNMRVRGVSIVHENRTFAKAQ